MKIVWINENTQGQELEKNEYVLFPNGTKVGYLEARYDAITKSFYIFDDETGEKLYSNDVHIKPARKKREYKKQTDISKMKEIHPLSETEKAYCVEDGSNGLIGKGCRVYYKYYAKSICVIDNSKIYAPIWA